MPGNFRPNFAIKKSGGNRPEVAWLFAIALFLCAPISALAGDGLVNEGEFTAAGPPTTAANAGSANSGDATSESSQQPGRSTFFGGPLSGQVSVMDHLRGGSTRLKRNTIPVGAVGAGGAAGGQGQGDGVANSHDLGGLVEGSGAKFQSLFPSLDKGTDQSTLHGGAQQAKPAPAPPKSHPIWEKSPLGGYYDASGNVREVIKGGDLWRYGGTMADGITPAPSGPVQQNSMGYIKWQPIHGGPAGWY